MAKTVKKSLARILIAVVCCALCEGAALAGFTANEVVPMGRVIGIQFNTEGMMVVGLSKIETEDGMRSPAVEAGILPGDEIIRIGATDTDTVESFIKALKELDGSDVSVTVLRGGKKIQFQVTPAKSKDGVWQIGVWLRNGVSGIGTMTFYDPKTGLYGALGHGVCDTTTGRLMTLSKGKIMDASVTEARHGEKGAPGELCGIYDRASELGSIDLNSVCGIFGTVTKPIEGEVVPVASDEEITTGPATILSDVDGNGAREYGIEIVRIFQNDSGMHFMICVTDDALIKATGGIVQGMSGSPIMQNGKLIGAVTHVLVDDPTRGYGVSIENMLSTASDLLPLGNAA